MMSKRFLFKKKKEKRIASERISQLYEMASENISKNPLLARRYTEIANKIRQKIKVKPKPEHKRMICKKCRNLIVPGVNCRVRLTGKTITYYCMECKNFNRFGYKNENKSKNKTKNKDEPCRKSEEN